MLRAAVVLLVLGLGVVSPCWPQASQSRYHCGFLGFSEKSSFNGYTLYAWQDSKEDRWNFCFVSDLLGFRPGLKDVVEGDGIIRGLEKLRQSISTMPPGSAIRWTAIGTELKLRRGTVLVVYLPPPPQSLFEEIKRFAEERHIKVVGDYCLCDHCTPGQSVEK